MVLVWKEAVGAGVRSWEEEEFGDGSCERRWTEVGGSWDVGGPAFAVLVESELKHLRVGLSWLR